MHWPLLLLADASTHWLFKLVVEWSYLGVFALLLLCGLGFPCPEEVALIGGGYAVYKSGGGWGAVILMVTVAMIGVLVGDTLLWLIGRRVGDSPERLPMIGRHLTPVRMRRARALFRQHGPKAVFFGRFLFGIRAVTFFVAGSMRLPLPIFLLMDGLGGLVSVPISVILAWHFGGELEQAVAYLKQGNRVILLAVAIAIGIIAFRIWTKRHELAAMADELDPGEATPAAPGAPPAAPPEGAKPPTEQIPHG